VCVCASDPARDECFGGVFSQFLLDELLGYDNIILYSLKQLAHDKPDKGSTNCLSVCVSGHRYSGAEVWAMASHTFFMSGDASPTFSRKELHQVIIVLC